MYAIRRKHKQTAAGRWILLPYQKLEKKGREKELREAGAHLSRTREIDRNINKIQLADEVVQVGESVSL